MDTKEGNDGVLEQTYTQTLDTSVEDTIMFVQAHHHFR